MKTRDHGLSEKEIEHVQLLMANCQSTGDIQAKLKRLFAGTIEQTLEAEMDEHLGYGKNSILGNNSGNSRNGYGKRKSQAIMEIARLPFPVTAMENLSQRLSKKGRHEQTKLNRKLCRCTQKECPKETLKIRFVTYTEVKFHKD